MFTLFIYLLCTAKVGWAGKRGLRISALGHKKSESVEIVGLHILYLQLKF